MTAQEAAELNAHLDRIAAKMHALVAALCIRHPELSEELRAILALTVGEEGEMGREIGFQNDHCHLVNAKFVVAIISEKYLRSPYCMFEIYKVFQACQGDTDKLLQRILPVVLPEVRLAGLKQRAPYLKHWKEERETAEELLRDLGLSVGSKSHQECRLVVEFAHHIDDILTFIQDVLLPRNLETQLADDFEAVRQALKRRIGSAG
jgi:hypothetical protein